MDREYLEDYQARELREYELLKKKIKEGKFHFEKDSYPPDDRFQNLKQPVAHASTPEATRAANIWAQVPFCGSLIIDITPLPKPLFEQWYFKVSEIPRIVDFIKETGKLQITISSYPRAYQGCDHLDLIFEELNPPYYGGIPNSIFGDAKDIKMATESFMDLAQARFLDFLEKISPNPQMFLALTNKALNGYIRLKLSHYAILENIENLMIDDPVEAYLLLHTSRLFITDPTDDLRSTIKNSTLSDMRIARSLPSVYQKRDTRFPCEIGKFLLEHLTYAPKGLRACNDIIDDYDSYDLQKVQKSLNEAIITNHPDIVNENIEELSDVLNNVWNDKTIPRRITGLNIGVPLLMAAIGHVAAGPIGVAGGFLAGLGFDVLSKSINIGAERLSEKLAKLRTKSYQANVYDFKKKYKGKIARPSKRAPKN